ncbi:MAG: metallophosphoesterase [Hydrogenophaga sp.]|nr:metallophosphoesterase [Hydrogenophaga sp.]MDZ4361303.1 metallophosphoesterase [Variovorax sp.]
MNIQLLSDLHLEANPDFVPQPAPGADLLVLAGDVGSYQKRRDGSVMDEPDWGLQRFARWPVPVLFVPGNHEYDALDVDEAHERLRETCERLGLLWLERETRMMQGVRFVGTTLWSDYDVLGQREKAFRAANHYLVKMASERDGQLFDAEAMRALAMDCQRWLRQALAEPFDGTTVVVTHFAPTLHSMDPRYGKSPGTAGFCNALDDWLPQADLWLHGHLHCPTDVQVGRCRIVANPLGYADKNEQGAFVAQQLIAVPERDAATAFEPAQGRPVARTYTRH